MSTFSAANYDATRYSEVRPTYPSQFYQFLNNYHIGQKRLVVDVGCGPGTASFQIAQQLTSFDKVIGTDLSPTMIQAAKVTQAKENKDTVKKLSFDVSPSDNFDFLGPDLTNNQSVDMITAVECAHWFDFSKFQNAAFQNLSKDGTIAVWGYGDPIFLDYPTLDQSLWDLSYADDSLGPYWEQPGRKIIRGLLRGADLDPKLFKDIKVSYVVTDELRSRYASNESDEGPLIIDGIFTLKGYKEYIQSWSAYHQWKEDKINIGKKDVIDVFIDNVLEKEKDITLDTKIKVVWSTFYKLGRRI